VDRKVIVTDRAYISRNPLSQALKVKPGELLFCSGQLPIDPETETVVEGGIAAQTKQVLDNLKAVLEAGGSSLEQVVKTTVFLTDIRDAPEMNKVYRTYFAQHPPTRSCVEVAALARREARIEIEIMAVIPSPE
jgi:2-iminobutanoate/2-iminopropanoate deaminase